MWNLMCSSYDNCHDAYFSKRYPCRPVIIDGPGFCRRVMAKRDQCQAPDVLDCEENFDDASMHRYLDEVEKTAKKETCATSCKQEEEESKLIKGEQPNGDEDSEDSLCDDSNSDTGNCDESLSDDSECEESCDSIKERKSACCRELPKTMIIKCTESSLDEVFSIEEGAMRLFKQCPSGGSSMSWRNLIAPYKMSYLWVVMTGEVPKADPFKNFKRFYLDSERPRCTDENAMKVWNSLEYNYRIPFIMEAFIAQMFTEQVNIDDETDIERCFVALEQTHQCLQRNLSRCERKRKLNNSRTPCKTKRRKLC